MLTLLLVAALAQGDLRHPQAVHWYRQLLEDSGYGRLPREKAAFLIRERDGAMTLQPWANGEVRRASYRGTVPARAIAVVHTHPHLQPNPSRHDRDEARRLGLPVIVLTTDAVIAVMSDGREETLVRGRWTGK